MIETRASPSSATTANSKKWDSKPLGEVCEIKGGGTPSTKVQSYWQGDLPWVSPKDMKSDTITDSIDHISNEAIVCSATNLVIKESILMVVRSGILTRTVPIAIAGRDLAINQDIKAFTPKPYLNSRFLYLFLESQMDRLLALVSKGATVHRLNVDQLKTLRVPLPSLKEQGQIVAILDEALEGIATAQANAEQSLENSRALFSSYLDNLEGTKRALGSLVDIKTGKLDANAAVVGGIYPFFTCSREIYAIDKFAFDCHAILLAGNNAVGDFNVKIYQGKFNAYQRTYVITIPDEKSLSHRYLYYQILKSMNNLKQQSVGAGTKFLKIGMINNLEIIHPPLSVQESVVASLDCLLQETQRLEAVVRQKLLSLDELRQSLLDKAFSGNL